MLFSDSHSLIYLTFYGSIFNSFEEKTKPKYMSSFFIKDIFLKFINNFSCYNFSITDFKCHMCYFFVLLKISMSSRYIIKNFPMKSFNTSFINLINVLGAFFNPNGMTNHSNNHSFVLNFVFHSSPSLILI
jgi:hypothetical protein